MNPLSETDLRDSFVNISRRERTAITLPDLGEVDWDRLDYLGCEDVRLPNPVAFFSARRGGAPGRRGDTIGTLVCEDFDCSANVRRPPPPAYLGFDVDAAVWLRVETLREHVANFARRVAG